MIDSGRGTTTRAEDAQGTPNQSHTSPSIRVYEDNMAKNVADDEIEVEEAATLLEDISSPEA